MSEKKRKQEKHVQRNTDAKHKLKNNLGNKLTHTPTTHTRTYTHTLTHTKQIGDAARVAKSRACINATKVAPDG